MISSIVPGLLSDESSSSLRVSSPSSLMDMSSDMVAEGVGQPSVELPVSKKKRLKLSISSALWVSGGNC